MVLLLRDLLESTLIILGFVFLSFGAYWGRYYTIRGLVSKETVCCVGGYRDVVSPRFQFWGRVPSDPPYKLAPSALVSKAPHFNRGFAVPEVNYQPQGR